MPRPSCPKCHEVICSRRKREGFFQVLIYPYFGLYPWACSACRHVFVVKERGKSKRRHHIKELEAIAAERAAANDTPSSPSTAPFPRRTDSSRRTDPRPHRSR